MWSHSKPNGMIVFDEKPNLRFGLSPQQIGFVCRPWYSCSPNLNYNQNIWVSLQYGNLYDSSLCMSLRTPSDAMRWALDPNQILNHLPTLVCSIGNHFLWTTITELGHTTNLAVSYFLKTLDAKHRLVKLYAHAEWSYSFMLAQTSCG